MNNFFVSALQIDIRYDIKGSTYNRKSKDDKWDRSIALKDLDLIDNYKQGQKFNISTSESQKYSTIIYRILSQIKRDVHFFSLNNIIDYSLLVGVHHLQKGEYCSELQEGKVRSR